MTQEQSVLCLLRSGPKTTADFCSSIYRLAAEYRRTVSTLRKKGYDIRATQLRRGCWEYRLVAEPPTKEANGQLAFA